MTFFGYFGWIKRDASSSDQPAVIPGKAGLTVECLIAENTGRDYWHLSGLRGSLSGLLDTPLSPVCNRPAVGHCAGCDLSELYMHTEPVEPKDFVASWLMKAKADAALNQDMVGLLADYHGKGTATDDNILKAVLKLTVKPGASNGVH